MDGVKVKHSQIKQTRLSRKIQGGKAGSGPLESGKGEGDAELENKKKP